MAIVSKESFRVHELVCGEEGVIKGGNGFSLESISSLVCLQETDFAFWIQMSSNEILSRQITLHDFTHDIILSIVVLLLATNKQQWDNNAKERNRIAKPENFLP